MRKAMPEIITDRDYVLQILHQYVPDASDAFVSTVLNALELHGRKSRDYTHGEAPYGNFERVAQLLKLYPTFPHTSREGVCIIYMLKQFDAVMNSLGRSADLKEEGIESRLQDIGVYAFILLGMYRSRKA